MKIRPLTFFGSLTITVGLVLYLVNAFINPEPKTWIIIVNYLGSGRSKTLYVKYIYLSIVYTGLTITFFSGVFVGNIFGRIASLLIALFALFFGIEEMYKYFKITYPDFGQLYSIDDLFYIMAGIMFIYLLAMLQHRSKSKLVPITVVIFFTMVFLSHFVLLVYVKPLIPYEYRSNFDVFIFEIEFTPFIFHGFALSSLKFRPKKEKDDHEMDNYFNSKTNITEAELKSNRKRRTKKEKELEFEF